MAMHAVHVITYILYIANVNQIYMLLQIMAVVVILIGGTTTTFFQIFIKEDGNVCLPTQKWYKWISTPTIYFVSYTKMS